MQHNLDTIFNVVLGTAGHIDHGKSTLVRRLTGVDPDRLPEEKDRGLTIDLGFAPLQLPDGRRIGIVDVPGHERLIKNMVAGATGIDLVLLVVAADDGVMPQTEEHVTIMQVLGLRRGLVAITKVDLVDEDMRQLVREDVRETLRNTFLADAPVLEVSAQTGEGIEELRRALVECVERTVPREAAGIFRMPIQRVFSLKGFGTVVTGIPVSGAVAVGDLLEVLPARHEGRVRGIHAYGEPTDLARAGHSSAVNITDVDYRAVTRGMVVAEPGYFEPTRMFEAELTYLPRARRPLVHQAPIRLHTGTAEVIGRVYLLEKRRVEPGESSLVQFRLAEDTVAAPGDRFVLRAESPVETVGGGTIIDRSRWRLKSGKAFVLDRIRNKQSALGDRKKLLAALVSSEGYSTIPVKDLPVRLGLPPADTRALIEELVEEGKIRRATRAGHVISVERLAHARAAAGACARSYYRENPRSLFMEKALLRRMLGCQDAFFQDLLLELEAMGEVHSESGGTISWRDFGPRLDPEDEGRREEIIARSRERPFTPPTPGELAEEHGWDGNHTRELFDLLAAQGELVKAADGIYFHKEAADRARGLLRDHLRRHGAMTASDARKLLESTRKYCIPLLEQLDREGFTVRKGDVRELRDPK